MYILIAYLHTQTIVYKRFVVLGRALLEWEGRRLFCFVEMTSILTDRAGQELYFSVELLSICAHVNVF